MSITCKICGKQIKTFRGLSSHISRIHKDTDRETYYRTYIMEKDEDVCCICEKNKTKFISMKKGFRKCCKQCNRPKTKKQHMKVYGNLERYYEENKKRRFSNSLKGLEHNHGKEMTEKIRQKFSNTKESWIKKYGKEQGIKKWNEYIRKQKESSKRCIEYWIKKGYTEEEAKQKVSESQRTFSKEICIEKYGEEEGLKRWKERQERWQNTLKSKPKEEIERINKKKFPGFQKPYFMSNAERHLSEKLKCVSQIFINGHWYDLYKGNKIIEYNGDYWHCNPKMYNPDYYNERLKMTAAEKWNKDGEKIKNAEEHGFKVMVIWEDEYKKDYENVIERCLEFLNG